MYWCLFEKIENKRKRGRGWPIKKNLFYIYRHQNVWLGAVPILSFSLENLMEQDLGYHSVWLSGTIVLYHFFFLKPASFRLFLVFSNKKYRFFNKSMWKNVMTIQYTATVFESTTSLHELSRITTQPPYNISLYQTSSFHKIFDSDIFLWFLKKFIFWDRSEDNLWQMQTSFTTKDKCWRF